MTGAQIDRIYQEERRRVTMEEELYRERHPSHKSRRKGGYARKRTKTIKQATPKWSNDTEIALVYEKRDLLNDKWKLNFEVDHIVPLHGKTVCGLHCLDNLQLLVKEDNRVKNNKIWIDK